MQRNLTFISYSLVLLSCTTRTYYRQRITEYRVDKVRQSANTYERLIHVNKRLICDVLSLQSWLAIKITENFVRI